VGADSSCSECPAGTTTKLVAASSLAECEACGLDQVAERAGSKTCVSCGADAGPRHDRRRCWCNRGFFLAANGTGEASTDKTCKECPVGATCDWDHIQAMEKYWRASAAEEQLHRCPSTYCEGERLATPDTPDGSLVLTQVGEKNPLHFV
jgi:hypothetical protein